MFHMRDFSSVHSDVRGAGIMGGPLEDATLLPSAGDAQRMN